MHLKPCSHSACHASVWGAWATSERIESSGEGRVGPRMHMTPWCFSGRDSPRLPIAGQRWVTKSYNIMSSPIIPMLLLHPARKVCSIPRLSSRTHSAAAYCSNCRSCFSHSAVFLKAKTYGVGWSSEIQNLVTFVVSTGPEVDYKEQGKHLCGKRLVGALGRMCVCPVVQPPPARPCKRPKQTRPNREAEPESSSGGLG